MSAINSSSSIFQSTPSAWRATLLFSGCLYYANISIHALRVEGDVNQAAHAGIDQFQSTPSAWRATVCSVVSSVEANISIHALRVEGDAG